MHAVWRKRVASGSNRVVGIVATIALLSSAVSAEERGRGVSKPEVGESRFFAGETVEYVAGSLPIIIAAPHGGRLVPAEIPDRKDGVLLSDRNTDWLAREIADALREVTGESPHLVLCHLKRIKVDCNRDLLTGTAGNAGAEKTWRAYHQAIGEARAAGGVIYLDIHGHSHPERNIELGYLLTNAQLKDSGEAIVQRESRASVAAWKNTSPDSFAERLRGQSSLGGQLEKRGFPSVPSPSQPHAGDAKYFSGGYNTARYGSIGENPKAVAIQVETPFPGVRDTEAHRKGFARALAESLVVSIERHAGIELPSAEPTVLLETGFESEATLVDWRSFADQGSPSVKWEAPGVLRGERSSGAGLVALSRDFEKPVSRAMIDFRFAVSAGQGRAFHVWTQEPGGQDASQLNLCVQRGQLQQFDGRTRSWESVGGEIRPTIDSGAPVWHRIRIVADSKSDALTIFLSRPGESTLPDTPTATVASYRSEMPLAGLSFVSGRRIAEGAWYLVDDLLVEEGEAWPRPGPAPVLPEPFPLWSGEELPKDPEAIPFAEGIEHRVIHRPDADGYRFLHGAAIIFHEGTWYAHWANSPVNENGPHETLQGRRSHDGGRTWTPLEKIGPGFEGEERHSHGVFLPVEGRLWSIAARFGVGKEGKRFPGLRAEAFELNPETDRWNSRGIVMENCWPYDEPVRMGNGSYLTGGQDRDGLPVVAFSQGSEFEKPWKTVPIPFPPRLAPSFAETTVWAQGPCAMAVIRGGGGVAWISTSEDCGETWTEARPANLPMPRAKAYLGKLSTDQLYLVSNYQNRDTLVISTGKPGEGTLCRMWRLRQGRSEAPRFPGFAKSPQWSYPFAHEHEGKLWVVYSIGKEECGLTIVPLESLEDS